MYSAFDLTGKVALITGGNGGIGLGMARALAQAGASVCIWGTSPQKNSAALAELEDLGAEAQALECDVGDRAQVESQFAATLERFGRVVAELVARLGEHEAREERLVRGLAKPSPSSDGDA